MDAIRLRTMTWKSIFSSGKYQGCSVRMAYDIEEREGPSYLAWLYYHCSNISFCEEILNEIDLTPELRIDKPGKSVTMWGRWRQHYYNLHYANQSETELMAGASYHKAQKRRKYRLKHIQIENRFERTKSQLQVRNQSPKFTK